MKLKNSGPKIGAVIWTSSNIEAVLGFYRAIGIPLEADTHGEEPSKTPHFEADLNGVHYAVFPAKEGLESSAANRGIMLGISVDDLEATLRALVPFKPEVKVPPEETPWGKRSVVYDPDGRALELFQPPV